MKLENIKDEKFLLTKKELRNLIERDRELQQLQTNNNSNTTLYIVLFFVFLMFVLLADTINNRNKDIVQLQSIKSMENVALGYASNNNDW